MSAITSARAPIETETPVTPAVESGKVCRREEFRSALDNYIAGYIADQQKRRPIATGYVGSELFHRLLAGAALGAWEAGQLKDGRNLAEHSFTLGRRTLERRDGAGRSTQASRDAAERFGGIAQPPRGNL